MTARSILNLVLLLLVAGLGLVVYYQPGVEQPHSYALSKAAPGSIVHIKIEKPGQPALDLRKENGRWFLVQPFRARADELKISRLLEILGARSEQRFEPTQLSRFELDKPLLTLTIGKETFRFGTLNPLTQAQYVASADAVLLLPTRYFSEALASPADFSSKRLFADDEIPEGFSFPHSNLQLQEGRWQVSPANPELSADKLNQWAEEWRYASALVSQPYAGLPSQEAITITLKGGKKLPLQILQRSPEFILLRGDEDMQYHFPQASGERLLQPEHPL
jgi:hypothetical protein